MLATRGCLPFKRVEGKTQSAVWEYVVFCFQRSMNSASNGWSGTGPFDALLFGKPTWPHVQVRRTWVIPSAKLTSCHDRRAPGSQGLPLYPPDSDRLPNRRHGDIHPCFAVVDEHRQPHRALVC